MYIYRLFYKLRMMDTRSFGKIVMVFTVFAVMASFLHLASSSNVAFAQVPSTGVGTNQPNINAENLFNTRTMVLGNNVENLVILIPNEAHHGPNEESEARFLEQQFVPETAVINPGTTVAWFNGDVGHERTVDVANANAGSLLFSTGVITDMQVSKTITFNSTGTYNYKAMGDPGVTMRGAITVSNIQSPVTNSANGEIDTVGVLMVPAQDKDAYIQEVESGGLT